MWNIFDRVIEFLSWVGALIAAIALAIIGVSVFYEVIARGIFQSPTIWSMEVSTYAIEAICFLGLGWVLRQGRHLQIDFVVVQLPTRVREIIGISTDLFSAAFCALLVWYGTNLVNVSFVMGAVSVSELRVPEWIVQVALPVGFSLLCLEFIARIMARLGLVHRKNESVDIVEST